MKLALVQVISTWQIILLAMTLSACEQIASTVEVKTNKEAVAAKCAESGRCVKDPTGLVVYNSDLVTDKLVLKQNMSETSLAARLWNLVDEPKLLKMSEKIEPLMRGVTIVKELEPCDSPNAITGLNPTVGQLRELKEGRYKACIAYVGEGLTRKTYALDPIAVDTTGPQVSTQSVTVAGETSKSAVISWSKAGDNVTLEGNLSYFVYLSKTDLLNSLDAVRRYGNPQPGKVSGVTSYVVDNLSAQSLYHAAVVAQDEAGNETLVGSANFTTLAADTTPPASPSIAINGSATYTTTQAVTLTLGAVDADQMYVTNSAGCASGGDWEPYGTSKSWTLIQINSTATVYVKFKDTAGNAVCVNDTIIHDNIAPTAPSVTGVTPTSNATPTWSWISGGGGNGTYRYKLNSSDLSTGATETTSLSFTPSSALSEATHTLYVQERDDAGNWSASGSFVIQVATPPAAPILLSPTRLVTSLGISWSNVSGATSYNLYWSTTTGVTTSSSTITNVTSTYTHTPLIAGTTYYYKVAAVKNGIVGTLSNEVSASPLTMAPTVTSITANAGAEYGGTAVTITGTGFVSGASVTIGGASATGVSFVSSTSLTATTPAGSVGARNVVVTNPDGQTGTLTSGFTYIASPVSGPASIIISSNSGTSATLSLYAPSSTEMYVTNTSGCASGGVWEALQSTKVWILTNAGDGTGTVYAKFRNAAWESECVSHRASVTGSSLSAEGQSCAEIYAAGSSRLSGVYLIDPDGTGPLAAENQYCNMSYSGGGWTLVVRTFADNSNVAANIPTTAEYLSAQTIGSVGANKYILGNDRQGFTNWGAIVNATALNPVSDFNGNSQRLNNYVGGSTARTCNWGNGTGFVIATTNSNACLKFGAGANNMWNGASDGSTNAAISIQGSPYNLSANTYFAPFNQPIINGADNDYCSVIRNGTITYGNGYACRSGMTGSQLATRSDYIEVYAKSSPIVATPVASRTPGTYAAGISVTLTTTTAGATIYYTTDGLPPTISSEVYSSAISVSSNMTIKALATKTNYTNSDVTSAEYVIDSSAPVLTSLSVTTSSPGTSQTPSVSFTSNEAGTAMLYSDAGCLTGEISASAEMAANSNTLTSIVLAANRPTSIYAKATDAVGNYSCTLIGSYTHDDIAPSSPIITGTTPTSNTTPTWSWSSGGNGGNGTYRYKLNSTNLTTDATETTSTSFTPGYALAEGPHTLYVQERDTAGNWSASGSLAIQVVTPPAAPTLSTPSRYTTSLGLSWSSVNGATAYNLYWSTSAGVTTASTKISNVSSAYTHSPLTGGATYYYKLAAVKSGIEGAMSNEVSSIPYTFAAPTVTNISPNSGPLGGGTTVTITGTGFRSGVLVTIGGGAATSVNLVSSTSITAITPAGSAGAQNVVVTNTDGQTITLTSGYTYLATACAGDCYLEGSSPNFAQDLAIGTERQGPSGSTLTLQFANGTSGFKIWKEKGGTRILNSSGIAANGWQKQLTRAGRAFTSTDFTTGSNISGRVCPSNVFIGTSLMTATGRCLYYDGGNPDQSVDRDTGTRWEDNLWSWGSGASAVPSESSYYEGNIKTCADKGMRLPTMYETTMNKPTTIASGYTGIGLPIGDGLSSDPIWAGSSNGVPSFTGTSSFSHTSSAFNNYNTSGFIAHGFYWTWSGTSNAGLNRGNLRTVRCVLPNNIETTNFDYSASATVYSGTLSLMNGSSNITYSNIVSYAFEANEVRWFKINYTGCSAVEDSLTFTRETTGGGTGSFTAYVYDRNANWIQAQGPINGSYGYSVNYGQTQFYADATNNSLIGSACDSVATSSNNAASFNYVRIVNGTTPQKIKITWDSVGY